MVGQARAKLNYDHQIRPRPHALFIEGEENKTAYYYAGTELDLISL